VEHNEWRTLHPIFYHFVFQENKIHQKMQREKLYNLDKTAYFIVAVFVFKMNKIFERSNFDRAKMIFFFEQNEFVFSYLILLLPDMFY
jgi:hypothetical protein